MEESFSLNVKEFAVRAGENAMKQLVVARKFGDKTVIAKVLLAKELKTLELSKYLIR